MGETMKESMEVAKSVAMKLVSGNKEVEKMLAGRIKKTIQASTCMFLKEQHLKMDRQQVAQ